MHIVEIIASISAPLAAPNLANGVTSHPTSTGIKTHPKMAFPPEGGQEGNDMTFHLSLCTLAPVTSLRDGRRETEKTAHLSGGRDGGHDASCAPHSEA